MVKTNIERGLMLEQIDSGELEKVQEKNDTSTIFKTNLERDQMLIIGSDIYTSERERTRI